MEERKEMEQEVSDERIRQVVRDCDKKRRMRKIWLRVVLSVVAFAIVAGACFFGMELFKEDVPPISDRIVMQIGTDEGGMGMVCNPRMSSAVAWGIRLDFLIDDPNMPLEKQELSVTVNRGVLHRDFYKVYWDTRLDENPPKFFETTYLGNSGTFAADEGMCWTEGDLRATDFGEPDEDGYGHGGVYLDVVIRVEGHIVGYAVVEMVDCGGLMICAELIASEYFPMVNGQYEQITQEQVNAYIAQAKE